MNRSQHLFFVRDAQNTLCAVQLSPELWKQVEPAVVKALASLEGEASLPVEPMEEFTQFLEYWDFKYPYSAAVACPHCGAETQDWRTDPEHPFFLTTANLGGLLVFRCRHCHSTIRQKHFRDHVAFECTPYEV